MVFFTSRGLTESGVSIGDIDVETEILLNENGAPVNYIIVNQGLPGSMYDASCEGTWCLRKDIAENRVWGSTVNLETSDIHIYLNGDWMNRYDPDVSESIKQVKIPYRQGDGPSGTDQSGENGLSCKAFLLSCQEVGWTTSHNSYFPLDGAKLSYFESGTGASANNKRIANLNGTALEWWPRSPFKGLPGFVWYIKSNGDNSYKPISESLGLRPCIILPFDFKLTSEQIVS